MLIYALQHYLNSILLIGYVVAKLTTDYSIPLKVVTARLDHLKSNFNGIMAEIEKKALRNLKNRKDNKNGIDDLITWDDWIYAALDIHHSKKVANQPVQNENSIIEKMLNKHKTPTPNVTGLVGAASAPKNDVYGEALKNVMGHFGVKARKPSWADNLNLGDNIPTELLDELAMPIGELVSVGSWMLTKNVYRFDDHVIKEILKSEFEGKLPNHIVNLPDIATYIQTDNADLHFQGDKVVGVIFVVSSLCDQRILITNFYLDTGVAKTIVISFEDECDIEDSLTDFVDNFQQDYDPELHKAELDERTSILKKLINLALWFSQKKPETFPLVPNTKYDPVGFKSIKGKPRLFEADKYKPYKVGEETGRLFKKIYSDLEERKVKNSGSGTRAPHLRKSHWHLYWYGPKGKYESWDLKLLPITIVGGE